MPLINCRDCETKMSSAANVCPKCGRPNNSFEAIAEQTMAVGNVVFSVILAAMIIGFIVWFILNV